MFRWLNSAARSFDVKGSPMPFLETLAHYYGTVGTITMAMYGIKIRGDKQHGISTMMVMFVARSSHTKIQR